MSVEDEAIEEIQVVSEIFSEIYEELDRADAKHPPMAEPVEGLYTLQCEVMELAREVHRQNKNPEEMRKEAIQVGAMAVKFIRDCCDNANK